MNFFSLPALEHYALSTDRFKLLSSVAPSTQSNVHFIVQYQNECMSGWGGGEERKDNASGSSSGAITPERKALDKEYDKLMKPYLSKEWHYCSDVDKALLFRHYFIHYDRMSAKEQSEVITRLKWMYGLSFTHSKRVSYTRNHH